MDLLIINNAGFIKTSDRYYITKTTGNFISDVMKFPDTNVSLFQFENAGVIEEGINDYIVPADAKILSIPFHPGLKKIWSYIYGTIKIFSLVHRFKGFIYIFYPGHISLIVAYACVFFKKPFGLYVRGEYKSRISKPIFRRAKFINTVGIVFQKEILGYNSNCNLIRPMVQFDFSKIQDNENVVRKNEILFVGRIEKRKGVWEIVKAAQKLQETFPNYKIRLIGAGQELEEITDYVNKNDISNIILHGPEFDTAALKQYYLQSKMFLFPSYDEGFPRVLYEAMLFNVPIITTFVGNIPGVMQHDYNCLRISCRSVESIISQVTKLISNEEISNRIVINGKKTLSLIFNDSIIEHSKLLQKQLSEYE